VKEGNKAREREREVERERERERARESENVQAHGGRRAVVLDLVEKAIDNDARHFMHLTSLHGVDIHTCIYVRICI